ncbi:MAG: hypothetical protein Q7U54_07015 [Bacteroidales bacterium]|nr:hypothetical protein [Bacteroidales bacterium]
MKPHTIFLFVIVVFLSSCSSKGHMRFDDVPIDGRIDKFASELTKQGFILSDSSLKNEIIVRGKFLNKECKISVLGTSKNNVAYKVIAELPQEVNDSLEQSFKKMQKLFSSTYGNGTTRYKQYKNPERFMFNERGLKRRIMKGDYSRYNTDLGILLMEVQDGFISITYWDKLNNEIRKREKAEEDKKESTEGI